MGVIEEPRSTGRVLIALRGANKDQGGLWEFPGGKVEKGESPKEALSRELTEEIGISLKACQFLMEIEHDYEYKKVLLHVFIVTEFSGEACGCEGQRVKWVSKYDLPCFKFPKANISILKQVMLSDQFMITGTFTGTNIFLQQLREALENGLKLITLRARELDKIIYRELSRKVASMCQSYECILLLTGGLDTFDYSWGDGVHLSSKELSALYDAGYVNSELACSRLKFLSASTHNLKEIGQASAIGCDLITLSPVKKTLSHPYTDALGFSVSESMTNANANMNIYWQGGMSLNDLDRAKRSGAKGISGISAWWPTRYGF